MCCAVYWIYLLRIVTSGEVLYVCVSVCICGFCNVCVYGFCVCVGFVMCGCFDNSVDVLVIRVLVFAVLCIVSFICTYSYLLLV